MTPVPDAGRNGVAGFHACSSTPRPERETNEGGATLDAFGTWGRPYERRPSPVRYGCRFAQIESGKRSWIATQTRFADADDLPSRKYSAMPRQ